MTDDISDYNISFQLAFFEKKVTCGFIIIRCLAVYLAAAT